MKIETSVSLSFNVAMAFSRAIEDSACHVITHSYSEPHIHLVAMETRCALYRWLSLPSHLSGEHCYFLLDPSPPNLSVRNVGTQTIEQRHCQAAESNRHREQITRRSEGPLPDLVQARSTVTDVGRILRQIADDFGSSQADSQPSPEGFPLFSWLRNLYNLIFR